VPDKQLRAQQTWPHASLACVDRLQPCREARGNENGPSWCCAGPLAAAVRDSQPSHASGHSTSASNQPTRAEPAVPSLSRPFGSSQAKRSPSPTPDASRPAWRLTPSLRPSLLSHLPSTASWCLATGCSSRPRCLRIALQSSVAGCSVCIAPLMSRLLLYAASPWSNVAVPPRELLID
jgi:hypothetical protein